MPQKAHSHADPWDRLQWFLGFDWAKDEHDVVVLDPRGRIVLRRTVPNTAEGWDGLREALHDLAGDDLAVVGVAIETSRGPDVDRILDLGCTVYPVHPVVSKRLRERKAPPGVKDNELDAWASATGCEPTATPGEDFGRTATRREPSECSAATRSPSSSNAPPWSISFARPCASTIPRPWRPSPSGRCRRPGRS